MQIITKPWTQINQIAAVLEQAREPATLDLQLQSLACCLRELQRAAEQQQDPEAVQAVQSLLLAYRAAWRSIAVGLRDVDAMAAVLVDEIGRLRSCS